MADKEVKRKEKTAHREEKDMTYSALKNMCANGNVELSHMAAKQFYRLSEESTENEVDRFIRRNHIDVSEADPDMEAWQEFMNIFRAIIPETDRDRDMFFELATGITDDTDVDPKKVDRLYELKPAAERWAAFTGSSLPDVSFLKV